MATTYFRYPVVGSGGGGGAVWGAITGTLSAQTDLQTALNLKAPLASPAFTGTATFGSYQSINADGSIGLTAADTSLGNHSAVFGYGATSSGFQGVAIGYGATSIGNYGIAIGTGSSADSYSIGIMGNALGATQGVAIGYSSKAYGTDTLALGFAATANSNYASAIGPGTSTAYSYSTVIGSDWSNSGNLNDTLAQGGLTLGGYNPAVGVATGEVWAALKAGATANTPRFILNPAVTTDDTTSAFQMTGVASFNANKFLVRADGSLGVGSSQSATSGTAFGNGDGPTTGAAATGHYSTAIGYDSTASAIGTVAVGGETVANQAYAVAIGWTAQAQASYAMAMGWGAHATGANSIVLGFSATDATYTESILIGDTATAGGPYSLCIGYHANTSQSYSIAIGVSAQAAQYSVALGYNANANDPQAIAIGANTISLGSGIAIGTGAHSTAANYNMALGMNTYSNSIYATVIGNNFNNDNALNDSLAPSGMTLGGMNTNLMTPVAENWVGVKAGATANTPRMLLGSGVTDDNSSAFQPYGAIKLCDYTTVGTPVKGQIAYNYTTGAITSYNGTAWV